MSVIVGTVVERIGIVKSCERGCCLVQAQLPLQGTYEIMPSTCIVATNCPVATCAIDLTLNRGLKTGVVSVHVAKHNRCEMFTCTKNGEATDPTASTGVIEAGWILLRLQLQLIVEKCLFDSYYSLIVAAPESVGSAMAGGISSALLFAERASIFAERAKRIS